MKRTFLVCVVTFGVFLGAAGAPSPIYEVFQRQWRFSPTTLTIVFAIYALSLLVALLVVGSLSDYLGRRPTLLAATAMEALSLAALATADGVTWLLAARALQGFATGLATATLSASLIDAEPGDKPGLGPLMNVVVPLVSLGVGALMATILVSYLPWPTHLVFWVFFAGSIGTGIAVGLMSETVNRKPGWWRSLVPVVVIPPGTRKSFLAMTPSLAAGWALAGLYLSLGPSVSGALAHHNGGLLAGFVILALTGAGALTSALFRKWTNDSLITSGTLIACGGLCITAYSVTSSSVFLFLVGSALAGGGFGPAFMGAFRRIMSGSPPAQRAGLAAAVYVVSYLSFGAPVVVAGIAAGTDGLRPVVIAYTLVAGALFLYTLVAHRAQLARSRVGVPGFPAESTRPQD